MAEVKVSRDTKVVIGLSEAEASRLKQMLMAAFDFENEPLACDIYEALDANEITGVEVEYAYSPDDGYFLRDESDEA